MTMSDPTSFYAEGADIYATRNAEENMPEVYNELRDTFIKHVEEGCVLDAGCGHGRDVEYFERNGLQATGIDTAQSMIELACDTKQGTFREMDIRDLDFSSDTFDGVWCNSVLLLFPPEEMVHILDECRRVLRPDGVLYTGFKAGKGTLAREKYGSSVRQYLMTEEKAKRLIDANGMQVIDIQRSQTTGGFDAINVFSRVD